MLYTYSFPCVIIMKRNEREKLDEIYTEMSYKRLLVEHTMLFVNNFK